MTAAGGGRAVCFAKLHVADSRAAYGQANSQHTCQLQVNCTAASVQGSRRCSLRARASAVRPDERITAIIGTTRSCISRAAGGGGRAWARRLPPLLQALPADGQERRRSRPRARTRVHALWLQAEQQGIHCTRLASRHIAAGRGVSSGAASRHCCRGRCCISCLQHGGSSRAWLLGLRMRLHAFRRCARTSGATGAAAPPPRCGW